MTNNELLNRTSIEEKAKIFAYNSPCKICQYYYEHRCTGKSEFICVCSMGIKAWLESEVKENDGII